MKTQYTIQKEFKKRLADVTKANNKLTSNSSFAEIGRVAKKIGFLDGLKWVLE